MTDWKHHNESAVPAFRQLDTLDAALQRGSRALRHLDDDLVNVLASIDIAIVLVDAQHRIRRITPRATTLLGLAIGDVGRPLRACALRIALGDLDDELASVVRGDARIERELDDGHGGWYRLQIRPYRHADRRIGGAVLSFVEITGLRASIATARAARDHAASIIETVPNPLVVLDTAGRICFASRALCELLGADRAVVIGRELFADGWRATDEIRARLATGVPFDGVEVELCRGGERRILACNARALANSDARLVLVGMIDITPQRRAEDERRRLAAATDAFVNAVTHELRTPLNAILLWTQVLRHCNGRDPQHARGLDTIERSVAAEAALVDDLIDLATARSGTGALAIAPEPADGAPLVVQATELLASIAAERGIELTVDALPARVLVDPRRFQQIVSKLVANAIKFTPDGGAVHVSFAPSDAGARLAVRDSGCGIRPELLGYVFEPFAHADGSLSRAHGGLGIGLALGRHLVECEHGTIRALSDGDGTGATFVVDLARLPD